MYNTQQPKSLNKDKRDRDIKFKHWIGNRAWANLQARIWRDVHQGELLCISISLENNKIELKSAFVHKYSIQNALRLEIVGRYVEKAKNFTCKESRSDFGEQKQRLGTL